MKGYAEGGEVVVDPRGAAVLSVDRGNCNVIG